MNSPQGDVNLAADAGIVDINGVTVNIAASTSLNVASTTNDVAIAAQNALSMHSHGGACADASFVGRSACEAAGHAWAENPSAITHLSGDQGVTVASESGDVILRSDAADGKVQLLGEGGVDIGSTDGNVTLHAATTAEIAAPSVALVSEGANVNLRAPEGSVNIVAIASLSKQQQRDSGRRFSCCLFAVGRSTGIPALRSASIRWLPSLDTHLKMGARQMGTLGCRPAQ